MGDPRDDAIINAVQERIDDVYTRLATEFGQRHDLNRRDNTLIQQNITDLAKRFAKLEGRIDGLERRLDGLERKAGYNYLLDEARKAAEDAARQELVPGPGTSRPAAIDHACAADPTDGPLMVVVPEFGESGLEIEPEPGSNPDGVWPSALHAIQAAGGGSGRKHRR